MSENSDLNDNLDNASEEEYDGEVNRSSDLEKEFTEYVKSFKNEIEKHLEDAHKHLEEAECLANERGLSFHSTISPLAQYFFVNKGSLPIKYKTMERKLQIKILEDYDCNNYNNDDDDDYTDDAAIYNGWQHSAVC